MPRFFNTAGPCDPADHYMLPPERRLEGLGRLIETKQYFVVHAPRQTGKTTSFRALAGRLGREGRFAVVHASCESGAGADRLELGISAVLWSLHRQAEALPEGLRPGPPPEVDHVPPTARLVAYLTRWSVACPRPLLIFLDEIDALRDQVLLSVLRQ
ncbi:MAG: ATP-binding protein, partial [Holophagales bacterium]|nr:ATP-binding protein [Holophagales bacterium]